MPERDDSVVEGPPLFGLGTSVYARRGDEILILKRAGGAAPGAWYTPGGVLDRGETPEQGAVRELEEETGLVPTSPLFLVGLIPTRVYGADTFLVAYACDCEQGEVRLSSEHTGFRWIKPEEYRERYFSDDNLRKLEAADAGIWALASAVRKGIDDYLAWWEERAR